MDEALNTQNSEVAYDKAEKMTKRLMDVFVYLSLLVIAVIMTFVGVCKIQDASVGSGIFYILIGMINIILMKMYSIGTFENF